MSNNRCAIWTNEENLSLLNIWQDKSILNQFDGTPRNRRVYECISKLLLEKGVNKSAVQVQNRIKRFKRDYKLKDFKDYKRWNADSGLSRYIDQLEKILGPAALESIRSETASSISTQSNAIPDELLWAGLSCPCHNWFILHWRVH